MQDLLPMQQPPLATTVSLHRYILMHSSNLSLNLVFTMVPFPHPGLTLMLTYVYTLIKDCTSRMVLTFLSTVIYICV